MKIQDLSKERLVEEIQRMQELADMIRPRKTNLTKLEGIDYYGKVEPLYGMGGGDYFSVVNFKRQYHLDERIKIEEEKSKRTGDTRMLETLKKNSDRLGLFIADASGHMISDCVTVTGLHQAFKIGVIEQMNEYGEVTKELFKQLNNRFYNLFSSDGTESKPRVFITFIYGEISSTGKFRYISGGHPDPIIFSNEFNKIMPIDGNHAQSTTPLGVLPSEYSVYSEYFDPFDKTIKDVPVNEINLYGHGDLLLLHTDCLIEHENNDHVNFAETRLEDILRSSKEGSARDIYNNIMAEMRKFSPIQDDSTLIVIKKK